MYLRHVGVDDKVSEWSLLCARTTKSEGEFLRNPSMHMHV